METGTAMVRKLFIPVKTAFSSLHHLETVPGGLPNIKALCFSIGDDIPGMPVPVYEAEMEETEHNMIPESIEEWVMMSDGEKKERRRRMREQRERSLMEPPPTPAAHLERTGMGKWVQLETDHEICEVLLEKAADAICCSEGLPRHIFDYDTRELRLGLECVSLRDLESHRLDVVHRDRPARIVPFGIDEDDEDNEEGEFDDFIFEVLGMDAHVWDDGPDIEQGEH